MALNNQRPDTPLAATPEPQFANSVAQPMAAQPVTSGLQPMAAQPAVQPVTKYQRTADTAIEQIAAKAPAFAPAFKPTGSALSSEGQNPVT